MYLGDNPVNAVIYVPLHTFNSAGASVTISSFVVGDIAIYKNGGTTQRTSTAGITLLDTDGIDFDGVTGIHGFKIDTSDNTDAGFYAAGSHYFIVMGPFTCDGQTLNIVAGEFWIEQSNGILARIKQAIPQLTAGAAGGLFIAGTNAPVAITGSGDALTLSSTGSNGVGLKVSGNGTGAGVQSTGGATGQGVKVIGGATSGEGVLVNTTSGDGIKSSPTAGHGLNLVANGTSKHGLLATGGTAGTSDGVSAVAGTGGVAMRPGFDTQPVESYATTGVVPTRDQMLLEVRQQMQQANTSGGTTLQIKKVDQSTNAFSMAINSASAPTSISRN